MTRVDTPERAKKREQGWGAINTTVSFVGAWAVLRYGFHAHPYPVVVAIGVGIPGAVGAWLNRRPKGPPEPRAPTRRPWWAKAIGRHG